ncbi:MAG: flagellar motor switch protein FliG [Hyphomicrobiales bacterium]
MKSALMRTNAGQKFKGGEKAAILMLSLGREHGSVIWDNFDDHEIKSISLSMAKLGNITSETVDNILMEFVTQMSATGAVMGNFDSTERLLEQFLNDDRVDQIMEEIRGPAGRNMWEKLSNVQEGVLANYLKNEYPQTVAVVLSKIQSEHAAKVLTLLPDDFALEVVNRMLAMESVQKEILDKVEDTLRMEFMSNLAATSRSDSHEKMANIFNNFDRQTESRFLTSLEEVNRESAERIKTLMFTFDDLGGLDPASTQTLLRNVERDKLSIALKGASDKMREFFFNNMSARAGKLLKEDMEVIGPIRLKDVDESQMLMINVAKDLAAKGEIIIVSNKGDDEMIY